MELFARGGDGELETRTEVGVGGLDSLLTYLGQPVRWLRHVWSLPPSSRIPLYLYIKELSLFALVTFSCLLNFYHISLTAKPHVQTQPSAWTDPNSRSDKHQKPILHGNVLPSRDRRHHHRRGRRGNRAGAAGYFPASLLVDIPCMGPPEPTPPLLEHRVQ